MREWLRRHCPHPLGYKRPLIGLVKYCRLCGKAVGP